MNKATNITPYQVFMQYMTSKGFNSFEIGMIEFVSQYDCLSKLESVEAEHLPKLLDLATFNVAVFEQVLISVSNV